MKILISFLIPTILVATGYLAYRLIGNSGAEAWKAGEVYAVWIEEVEVASGPENGRWDEDGSAPDLVASLEWRGNTVLKTPQASNTLLARWDRTALQLTNLLKGNFSPTELENIARIRSEPSENLSIEVRDIDLLSTEWAGGLSVPCGLLKVGKNQISAPGPDPVLRMVVLRVEPVERLEQGRASEQTHRISEGVLALDKPADSQPGAVEVREVGKQIEAGAKFLKGLFGSEPEQP